MRKVFISFLIILITSVSFITTKDKALAVGETQLLRVVGGSAGERILVGIGEKAGIKFATKKAQQEAVERWNLELYEKIAQAEKYGRTHEADQLKALGLKLRQPGELSVIEGGKNAGKGFGKTVLSAALFLTGLDLILDTVDSIETAIANEELLEVMEDFQAQIEKGKAYTTYGPYRFWDDKPYSDGLTAFQFGVPQDFDMSYNVAYKDNGTVSSGIVTNVRLNDNDTITFTIEAVYIHLGKKTTTNTFSIPGLNAYNKKYPQEVQTDYSKSMWMPDSSNIPSVPSVPWVTPWKSDPDTNKPVLPDEIPIEVPLQEPDIYNPGQPWNDPLPEYDPVPGDQPDKDYIPGIPISPNPDPGTNPDTGTDPGTNPDTGTNPDPGGNTNPDPGGNTEPVTPGEPTTPGGGGTTPGTPEPGTPGGTPNLKNPLSWIWIFLQFLLAVVMFLLRLGEFILTIPMIPAKQFPGVYGEMVSTFMNLKYGNIYPYKLMISIVNLAFGFVVYKILRRVFNG